MPSLRFLGTGGAFDPAYGNSAAWVEHGNQTLLLDCGFTVYPELVRRGLTAAFDGILLTHLHNDHCGSLANVLLHRYHLQQAPLPTIWYPADHFRDDIVGLLAIQVKNTFKYAGFRPLTELEGVRCLDTFGRHSEGYQSYAYCFEDAAARLVYSGDLGEPDFLFAWLDELPPAPRTRIVHEITFEEKGGGHTHYRKLLPYFERYPHFWGYHCDPTKNPPENPIPLAVNTPELML